MRRIAAVLLVTWVAAFVVVALPTEKAEGSRPSPLAEYPGFGHNAQADENRFNREEQVRELVIADCMQRKGFPYAPSPSTEMDESINGEELSALVENDPNNKYAASLSDYERAQYYMALAGTSDANNPGSDPVSGCIGEAHNLIPGVFAAFNALREPFEQMQDSISSDADVVAAEQRWSDCMLALGHSFQTTVHLQAALDDALEQPRSEEEFIELEQAHNQAMLVGAQCIEDVGLEAVMHETTVDYETQFVEQYRSMLEQYRDDTMLIDVAPGRDKLPPCYGPDDC